MQKPETNDAKADGFFGLCDGKEYSKIAAFSFYNILLEQVDSVKNGFFDGIYKILPDLAAETGR